MADAVGAGSSGRHEQVVELRKEASTMALYVAICLLAAFAALPETDAHTRVIGIIWGVTVGLALGHWFAFRVSARMVGAGSLRPHDVESAGAQLAGATGVALLASGLCSVGAGDRRRHRAGKERPGRPLTPIPSRQATTRPVPWPSWAVRRLDDIQPPRPP